MVDQNVPPTPKPVRDVPGRAWYQLLSLAMFLVGCASAFLSGRDISIQDKLAFLTAAVVFTPLGIAGLAMNYTAEVKAKLVQRIEELERRLRDKGGAEPSTAPDR